MSFTKDDSDKKLYENDWFIALLLVLFFPVGLFLMFKYSEWKLKTKVSVLIAIPVIIFVIFVDISPVIDKIIINPSAVNMELDSIKILDVFLEPSNANPNNVIYVSSDISVARVEKGRIYSVSPGKAKIYAYDKKGGTESNIINVTVCTSIIDADARAELADEFRNDSQKLENGMSHKDIISETTEWIKRDDVKIYEAGTNAAVASTHSISDETETSLKESDYQNGSGGIVYITSSGEKYHRKDCQTLKNHGIPIPKKDAERSGKLPCGKCNP